MPRAGKTEIESNLRQLLKLRAEDVPELLEWVETEDISVMTL